MLRSPFKSLAVIVNAASPWYIGPISNRTIHYSVSDGIEAPSDAIFLSDDRIVRSTAAPHFEMRPPPAKTQDLDLAKEEERKFVLIGDQARTQINEDLQNLIPIHHGSSSPERGCIVHRLLASCLRVSIDYTWSRKEVSKRQLYQR